MMDDSPQPPPACEREEEEEARSTSVSDCEHLGQALATV